MQNTKSNTKLTIMIILAVILLVAGVGAVVYALTRPAADTQSEATTTKETSYPDAPKIVFTDKGFTQDTYTFPESSSIIVENNSSNDLQFSSDNHPAHTDEPKLNMATLKAGASGYLMPPGKGTYGFHDDLNNQYQGTLIIN